MSATGPARPSVLAVGLVLGVAGVIGAAALLPYQVQLQLASGAERPPWTAQVPTFALYLLGILRNVAPLFVFIPVGLWASRRLQLGTPLVEAMIARRPMPVGTFSALRIATIAGVAGGILVIGLDLGFFANALPQAAQSPLVSPSPWMGFLASFYGGINEELMCRLFLLSFLALALRALARVFDAGRTQPLPRGIFWAANILAALLFAAGHLPTAAALAPLTTVLVVRTFVLNGLLAIMFGWFFRRSGLEAAMISHFSADIVLHVLAPLMLAVR